MAIRFRLVVLCSRIPKLRDLGDWAVLSALSIRSCCGKQEVACAPPDGAGRLDPRQTAAEAVLRACLHRSRWSRDDPTEIALIAGEVRLVQFGPKSHNFGYPHRLRARWGHPSCRRKSLPPQLPDPGGP